MDTSSQTELTSLNGAFAEWEVNMSLTEAGLLPARAKAVVELYAEQGSWATVKEQWHERRVHDRGSRGSAQQIFRILKRRLQAGGADLPPISRLHQLIEESPTSQAEAQLLYFYLIRDDNLFRFVLHEVLRRQGIDREEWILSPDSVVSVLSDYEYVNGESLEYADSTLRRWAQGFRSVLRDVGVVEEPYDETGTVPAVDPRVCPFKTTSSRFVACGSGSWRQRSTGKWTWPCQSGTSSTLEFKCARPIVPGARHPVPSIKKYRSHSSRDQPRLRRNPSPDRCE
jgi:hypothetical protein